MKRTSSLVWKEWHEVRAFLWIAMGVFIGLPLIGGLEALFLPYSRRFEISTSIWVLPFGGVLAVFVAVGATCRDFSGHLDDFWLSRPISATRWMLTKYLVGLAVVLVACELPLILEVGIDRRHDSLFLVVWIPFILIALYSLGFLAGCLVRRTAHAAMLGLAAMLLIDFLPMVLPPLHWLDVTAISDESIQWGSLTSFLGPEVLEFAAGMLGIAAAALAMALLTVRRGWQIDSGRKMMYGSISAALLILVSSTAFQLGTNLPILQQVDLPGDESVYRFVFDGHRGYAITSLYHQLAVVDIDYNILSRDIELSASGIKLGDPVPLNRPAWSESNTAQAPGDPEIVYFVGPGKDRRGETVWALTTRDMRNSTAGAAQPLWMQRSGDRWPTLYAWENWLCVIGDHLVAMDIAHPSKPRIVFNEPFYPEAQFSDDGNTVVLSLPPVPDMPPPQRLDVAIKTIWRPHCFDGEVVCVLSSDNKLLAYRLVKLTDVTALFSKIGQYEPTILEKIFGSQVIWSDDGMKLENGLLYVNYSAGGRRFDGQDRMFNPSISVFDTRGTPSMRLVGHFAAPGAWTVCPLPDGRALIGGDKLWLVGPPPHRGQD